MILRVHYLLLALFFWALIPTAHQGAVIDPDCPCPSVEAQDVVPLALKYREHICQLIEASMWQFHSFDVEFVPQPSHWLSPVILQPHRLSDPCYSYMSMQL